jgi:hypothetical protein
VSTNGTANAVANDETVLRRCHKMFCPNGVITRNAFAPTPVDTDGISVFRRSSVTPEEVRDAARKPAENYVAGLEVGAVRALGLSVVPTEGELPGHCSIPEITHASYNDKAQKNAQKELTKKLADLANKNVLLVATAT